MLSVPTIAFDFSTSNEGSKNKQKEDGFTTKKLQADVIVAGGGMSGICAAIAAKRGLLRSHSCEPFSF